MMSESTKREIEANAIIFAEIEKESFLAPDGLSKCGLKAHKIIVSYLEKHGLLWSGYGRGDRVFEHPENATEVLRITYDGGAHARAFSYGHGEYHLIEGMEKALKCGGFWSEQINHWSSAIYVL